MGGEYYHSHRNSYPKFITKIVFILQIIVKDLLHDKVETHIYDAIFVCIGVNSTPSMPKPAYSGAQLFQGRQSHSHNYRRASQFQGESNDLIP